MRVLVVLCLLAACLANKNVNVTGSRPNIVVLFVDDLGYGDVATYGNTLIKTPNIDLLAQQGTKFTSWYSASALCTPSRAALLTGRLPIRSGMTDDNVQVMATLMTPGGLPNAETTLAEGLKAAGYHTGMAGKWHLGVNQANHWDSAHMPSRHGFDYAGLISPMGNNPACANPNADQNFCIFYRLNLTLAPTGEFVTQQPWVLNNLSTRMVNEFGHFLTTVPHGAPFFWYHSFIGVHTPLFASPAFKGKSAGGFFGDMVEEMDAEVGGIMHIIRNTPSLADNTVVFFVSDNGPYREEYLAPIYTPLGYTAATYGVSTPGPFKGGKGNTYEGGFRVPAIAWGAGIQANVETDKMVSTMDIFPTALNLAGVAAPAGVHIDGKDITNLLWGNYGGLPANPWQNSVYPFYCGTQLMAARWKKFKMHYTTSQFITSQGFPTPHTLCNGECCPYDASSAPVGVCGCVNTKLSLDLVTLAVTASYQNRTIDHRDHPIIFDLSKDPHEDHPLTADNFADYEQVRATIQALVDEHRATVPSPLPPTQTAPPINVQTLLPCCHVTLPVPPYATCATNPAHVTPNNTNLYCHLEAP
jgi:steryl-sulfatase